MDNEHLTFSEECMKELLAKDGVKHNIEKFIKSAKDAIPLLKEYAAAIPEICEKLQEWIDDLGNQEFAVNVVNTASTSVGIVSTGLLFTPLAPFGLVGLVISGVTGATNTGVDMIANHVKGKKIEQIVNETKELVEKAEKNLQNLEALIEKVAKHGEIPYEKASTICFGLTAIAKTGAGLRVMLQGDRFYRLMGLFKVWRVGQLAPGGVGVIRGVAGAGSKVFGVLGAVLGVWVVYDGWANGNRTKNGTMETKKNFEAAAKATNQLIDLIEGRNIQ